MNKLFLIKTVLLISAFWLVWGCEEEEFCTLEGEIELQAGFYYLLDSTDIDTSLSILAVYGEGMEDSIYSDSSFVSDIWLPLSPFADSCSIVIQSAFETDTLSFTYQRELIHYSNACGFITEYQLMKVTHIGALIDSLFISNEEVNAEDEEHLKIYL